ncbi:MAG: tetratricopeptide repeat protein [Rhodocyclaceae bacterium]|nr:tetratricopeptide repeat protein [Rhodocyclaceae bacterium]
MMKSKWLAVAYCLVAMSTTVWAGKAEFESEMNAGLDAAYEKNFMKAVRHMKAAVREAEKSFEKQDKQLTGALFMLGSAHKSAKQYPEAESAFKRALENGNNAAGLEHLSVIVHTLDHLSDLYVAQGRHEESVPLMLRALAIREETKVSDTPAAGNNMNRLGETYKHLGRLEDAKPLFEKALAIADKTLGPNHPIVASILNNLIEVNKGLGRPAEAEPYQQRVRAMSEKATREKTFAQ